MAGRHAGKTRQIVWSRLATLIAVAIVVVGGLAFGADRFLASLSSGPAATIIANQPANILVLGVDDSGAHLLPVQDQRSFTGSDVMILVHVDPVHKTIALLSIPRDTRVPIPGYPGYQKIDAAHALGGPKLAMETVSQVFGVPVNGFVRLNYEGVIKMVNTLGGVPMDVPFNMHYTDHAQNLNIDLSAGPQVLDGQQASELIRFREYPTGDIERIAVQQMFIRAFVKRLLSFSSLPQLPALVSEAQQLTFTDLTPGDMLNLGRLVFGLKSSQIRMGTVPGHFETGSTDWFMDVPQTQTLIANLFQG